MKYIVSEIGIDRELICEFFFYFSRFEYALKREGYTANCGSAKADWDYFFKKHKDYMADICLKCEAAQLINKNPPQKQVVRDGVLDWKNRDFASTPKYLQLCINIRTIRNNLFHGGKFPGTLVKEISRNADLIRAALDVLIELSKIADIKKHFSSEEL